MMHTSRLILLMLALSVFACEERKPNSNSQPTAAQRARAEQIVQDVIASTNANLMALDDTTKILPAGLDSTQLYQIDDYTIYWDASGDGMIQCRYRHKAAARINPADDVLIQFDADSSMGRVYVTRMSPRPTLDIDDVPPHFYEALKSNSETEQGAGGKRE